MSDHPLRGRVALALDPDVKRHAGRVAKVADLGREYDFADIDGSRPVPFVLPENFYDWVRRGSIRLPIRTSPIPHAAVPEKPRPQIAGSRPLRRGNDPCHPA